MDDANVATDTGGDVTLLEDSRDAMALEDTRVADGMPIDSRADAPKDADAGPTRGSPGLACCAGESGDASDVGTGCGAYLTCSSGDGGTSTCRGCVAELANGYEYSCARRNDGTAWCWGYV